MKLKNLQIQHKQYYSEKPTEDKYQVVCKIKGTASVQHHLLVLQADGVIRKVNKWEIL